ncbi:MAG: trypsin-like peptidase domain-containing protein [Pyrinomonadaceae bacterium]|nr:trypsin-like peptidase domain-containing protein [Pyrinomonadaceae bacterium]
MANKAVYQLSARQILVIAFLSALFAAGIAILINNYGGFLKNSGSPTASAEETPQLNLSNPAEISDEQNSIEVYKTLSPGVAFINTTSYTQDFWGDVEEGKGSGSGSVIDNQGHIVTNYHVIEGAQKITVSLGGEKVYPAKLVGGDPDTDLAVIKIDPPQTGLTIIQFGDSEKLVVGQKVLAIGNPFGLDRTLTTGIISGLQRPIRARNDRLIEGAIQTDASINPGNSGGPLLDKFGKMIGINSQILSPAGGSVGVGFAIPISIAKRVIPQLIQFGEVKRPKPGANLLSVEQLAEQGVRLPVESGLLVRNVLAGGSFERAGIKGLSRNGYGEIVLGDIVLSIDGEKMTDTDALDKFLDNKKIGDTVQVEVLRGNSKLTVPVKLLTSPQSTQTRPARRF